jgi:hypothetical protein
LEFVDNLDSSTVITARARRTSMNIKKLNIILLSALGTIILVIIITNATKNEVNYRYYDELNSSANITNTITDNLSVFQNAVDYLESEKTNRVYSRETTKNVFYIWEGSERKVVDISEINKNVAYLLSDLDFESIGINESYVSFFRTGFSRDGTYFVSIEYYEDDIPDNTRHKIIDHWYYFKIFGT